MPCRCDYPEPSWNEEYRKIYEVYAALKKGPLPTPLNWGWTPYDERGAVTKAELDEKTEALCTYLNSRRKTTIDKLSSVVKNWLKKHNEMDANRKEEEKIIAKYKKKFEKEKQRNIAKMTPAERKLFGYDGL
jgi:hypothetical protein